MTILYNLSILSAIVGVILLACYVLILLVIKREMKKSMTNQLIAMWDIVGNKPVRVTVDIDEKGRAKVVDFKSVEKPDYMG